MDDSMGKRDPYQFRENPRWAALYAQLEPSADGPVKWGTGEPSDLNPFPTARDPAQHDPASYDYLVPGRVLVLTFRPIRFQSDLEAQAEFSGLLAEARNRYREEFRNAAQWLEQLRNRLLEPLPLPVAVVAPTGPALLHVVDAAESEEESAD